MALLVWMDGDLRKLFLRFTDEALPKFTKGLSFLLRDVSGNSGCNLNTLPVFVAGCPRIDLSKSILRRRHSWLLKSDLIPYFGERQLYWYLLGRRLEIANTVLRWSGV